MCNRYSAIINDLVKRNCYNCFKIASGIHLAKVETTADELEGFYIIRAILRSKVKVDRIKHRDAQSYFAILLDDNNRKIICRLYFSEKRNQIGIIDEAKKEVRYDLKNLDELYSHSNGLIKAVDGYLKEPITVNE